MHDNPNQKLLNEYFYFWWQILSIHQQKQDSTRINQPVLETTEKTTENHSIGNVDSSSSINIFHIEDRSSRIKLFQVDESNTKQDILQKKYSSK